MLTEHPFNAITSLVIKCAIEVHRTLGPGLLEFVYLKCLEMELRHAAANVEAQIELPLVYKGVTFECGYRVDLLVEDSVIVEVKAVAQLADVHAQQLLTYLKLTGKPAGLLINFNVPVLKNGVRRVLNTAGRGDDGRPAGPAAGRLCREESAEPRRE